MNNPTFQHRHYKAIAAMFAEARERHCHSISECAALETFQQDLARYFQRDNSRFNQDRFEAACAGTPSNGRDKVQS